MAEGKQPDLNPNEQDYILAKIALNHYGLMHDYFVEQMKYYTVACCSIAMPGSIKFVLEEKLFIYEIVTEKTKPLKVKGKKTKKISAKKYKDERKIAALNLKTWTKKLLSWPDADVRVRIDGTDEQ